MEAYYKVCLERELQRRLAHNPRYSLRAFARSADIDVSILSKILSRKMLPSPRVTGKLFAALGLPEPEQKLFRHSVELDRTRESLRSSHALADRMLDEETMEILSEWHHIALLELTQTRGFRNDPRWIARALGITELEARLSKEKLLRCGLLEEADGALRRLPGMLTTQDKTRTTNAHRRRQRRVLEKAAQSLMETPIEERSHTAVTLSIDESRLPEAKKLISEFNRRLSELLESGPQTRVYELSVALFPVQAKEKP